MPITSGKLYDKAAYWDEFYGDGKPPAPLSIDLPSDNSGSDMNDFSKGLYAGGNQMQALGSGLVAAYGSVTDNEDLLQSGMEDYVRNMNEAKSYSGAVVNFTDIGSAKDAGSWMAYSLGTLVPDIALMIGTGGVGGAIAKQAVTQGAKAFAEALAKQGAEEFVKAGLEKDAAEYIAKEAAAKVIQAKAAKAAAVTGLATSAVGSGLQGTGGSFAEILQQTGVEAPFAALGVGVATGALDALPFIRVFDGMFPATAKKDFQEFIASRLVDNAPWKIQALKDLMVIGGAEVGTEVLQALIERDAITWVNNNYGEGPAKEYGQLLTTEDGRRQLVNVAAVSLLGGTAIAAPTIAAKKVTGRYDREVNYGDDAKVVRTDTGRDPEFRSKIEEVLNFYEDPANQGKTRVGDEVQSERPVDPVTGELAITWNKDGALDPNTNRPYMQEQTSQATTIGADASEAPVNITEGALPADQQNSAVGEIQQPQTQESLSTVVVPEAKTPYGPEHRFDAPLSDVATPYQEQLLQLSIVAATPEAQDPSNLDVVVEAIDQDDVDRIFDRNASLMIQTPDRPKGKSLPTIEEAFGTEATTVTNAVAGVMADLSASGVPKLFMDKVTGVYVHDDADVEAPAMTGQRSRGVSFSRSLIGESLQGGDKLSEMAWSMTHEVYHAADFDMNLSSKNKAFGMEISDEASEPSVAMGGIMRELFNNWLDQTPTGKRFNYPFNDLQSDILDTTKPNGGLNARYRQEVFAQLGALFHSNPKELQAAAPLAYNYIKQVRDANLKTAKPPEVINETSENPRPADTSQPTGISGQVRAPPVAGSDTGVQPRSTRPDGEGSVVQGRADTPVEGSPQDTTGQRQRPDVQRSPVAAESSRTEVILKATDKKPTFKKADNWDDTGEQIITFADGDRYTVYFDDDAAEAGAEQWYTSADGTFTGAEELLGQTKAETITALQEHREKLLAAGKNSYNTPLDPQVGRETSFKAWEFISDKGQVTEKQLRTKFKGLEDNQFDNLVEGLLSETDPESVITLEDGKFLSYDYVQERDLDGLQSDIDDMNFISKSELPKVAQDITASDVLYGTESLDITGTSRNGARVVVDLAKAFDARVRAATGGRTLGDQTDENAAIVSDLIAHEAVQAMKTDGNAGEWYQQKVANAMSIAAKEFPELATDPNAKFAFTSIMAITSNGASVPENSVNTFKIYQNYRDSKVFPDFGVGKEAGAMKQAFALLNRLVAKVGVDNTRMFMDVDVTVKELKTDYDLKVSGELMGTKLKGSAIIGPKIGGGFYQNLNGNFNPLTMDRWFMRTWGRLTGTLMADADRVLPAQMAKFKEVALGPDYKSKLKSDGINRAQLAKDDDYAIAYATKVQSAYANGGFKAKNTINKAANTFKKSQGEKQAPQNGKEREYIRSVMRMALSKVNDTSGQAPVNMGALQAIIWYPEKDLYKQLGVGNAKSEPTDYETEFRKIVQSRQERGQKLSGSVGSAQQSGAGRVQSGGEPDVKNSNQPNGRQVKQADPVKSQAALKDVDTNEENSRSIRETRRPEQKRTSPKLKKAVQDRIDRNITAAELNDIFREEGRYVKPMHPDMIAPLKDDSHYVSALKRTSTERDGRSKESYWMSDALVDGQRYGSRLDIPSYSRLPMDERADIVTMHESRPNAKAGAAGRRLGYYPTISLKDVVFAVPEKGATKIAVGADKNTIATIEGNYVAADHEQNRLDFIRYMDDPAWTQISMNPERHSFYYDLANQTPVVSATQVVQVGNLVIAKDVVYDDVEKFSFIKRKQINEETGTLDDGTPSNYQFSFNDEMDSQADLARRFRETKIWKWFGDRYQPLREFEDQAAEFLGYGRLPAGLSPRDQENLSHGRVQKDLDEFHKNRIDPLGEMIYKAGFDVEAVGTYLLAKHAPERNDSIAAKVKANQEKLIARTENEIERLLDDDGVDHTVALETQRELLNRYKTDPLKFQDTGSGMTYAQSLAILSMAEREGTAQAMEKIAAKVYEMHDESRARMVEAELLDTDTKDDWEANFKFYVPLKGFAAQFENDEYRAGIGSRGFSIVGSESLKAKGRKTLPVNPLLQSIEDIQKKIIRARKNEVSQKLLELLSALGNAKVEDLLESGEIKTKSYTIYNNKFPPPMDNDKYTMKNIDDMRREVRDAGQYPNDPKYVVVKKGGQTFLIHFNSDTLNHSLQNMSVPMLSRASGAMDYILSVLGGFNTYLRNVLINYNPGWMAYNPIRDVVTGLFYAIAESDKKGSRVQGEGILGKTVQNYLPSWRALFRYYRGKPVREGNKMDQYAREFHEDGASTGMVMMKDSKEQLKTLNSQLRKGKIKAIFGYLGKAVEDGNKTSENSIRLSAYIAARNAGTDRETAATLAKDLTVNFNRKGEQTATAASFYLFFGAAFQGNVNFVQAMGAGTKKDGSKKNFTKARMVAAALVMASYFNALRNIDESEEDDDGELRYNDLPEHAKNRVFLVDYGGEEYASPPISYGYNFFTNLGRLAAEYQRGVIDEGEFGLNLWDNLLLNFLPVSYDKGDDVWQAARGFLPTIAQMPVDLAVNKNFFGSEIAVEQNELFTEKSTAYASKRSTPVLWRRTAEFLNDATGGDKYENGLLSISPERIDYVFDYLLGAVGRVGMQSIDAISTIGTNETIDKSKLPVVGGFWKKPSDYEDRFEFYDNYMYMRGVKARFEETTRGTPEFKELQEKYKPVSWMLSGFHQQAKKDLDQIRKTRKALEDQVYTTSRESKEDRRTKLLEGLLERENKVFDAYNKRFRESRKAMD